MNLERQYSEQEASMMIHGLEKMVREESECLAIFVRDGVRHKEAVRLARRASSDFRL